MKVRMTEQLREELIALEADPETFLKAFHDWKSRGPQGEDDEYLFGKDAEYSRPLVNGKRVLRHVHLVPEDEEALRRWNWAWSRGGRRVSDLALVYANGGRHGYLLIAILWEPTAHKVASMQSADDRAFMEDMAHVAEKFIFDGTCEV